MDNYVPEVTVRGAAIILIFSWVCRARERERESIVLYRTVTGAGGGVLFEK